MFIHSVLWPNPSSMNVGEGGVGGGGGGDGAYTGDLASTTLRWGTVDAEINASLRREPRAIKSSLFFKPGVGQNTALYVRPAAIYI